MALLLLIAGGVGFWLWQTGRLTSLTINDGLVAALGLLGVRLLTTGRVLAGAALVAGAVGWIAYRTRKAKALAPATMSVEEARALLELSSDADADAVRLAHRRLIARVHPDAGGSAALARNVNLARDTLLKDLSRTSRQPARGA